MNREKGEVCVGTEKIIIHFHINNHGQIAYSFDAGPNPFLFYEAKHADWLEGRLIRELQPQKVLRAGEGEQKELVGTGEIELMLLTRMGEGPRKVF